MKRDQRGAKRRRQSLKVWSHKEALAALPYLATVLRSVREHRLEALNQHRRVKRLASQPGRPNRDHLIALQEATRAAREADDRFQDALREIHLLDIYCVDPVAGLAFIPFAHDEQLAWFVYDLFDAEPLRFWRYHSDPVETRWPLEEMERATKDENG